MESKRSGKIPWTLVLLVLAFTCALSYGIAVLGTRVFNTETFGKYRTLDISNVQDLQTTSDGFVYYDGSTVSSISSSGDVKWSYLVGQDAAFAATDFGVAAWTGDTITLIDSKTGDTSYNGNMDEDVISACIGNKYTAILTGTEHDSTMILMENGGRQVNKISLDTVTAVDYGFFSGGSLLWVMVCDTNGTVPTCNIQTYKPGKEIVGSIRDTQQLVYGVMFQSSQICVAGDTYLKIYDYIGTEDTEKRRLIYGWYLADADEGSSDPLMVLVTDSQYGEAQIRDVRLIRSDLDRIVRMPFACMDIVAVENTVYGFSEDGHLMILNSGEQKVQSYRLDLRIEKVYGVTRDGMAIVGCGNTIYLVSLV